MCDASYDNDEYFIKPYMSIFDTHSINAESFNMGMEESSRMLCIPKDVTPRMMMKMNNNEKMMIMMMK